jgi:prepilin-type N-terminal cleavage/methylation domain-containing protein
MKTNPRTQRRGFTLVELLVVIVIIAALAGLTAPQVIKMKKKGDLADTTNNARQIGLGLAQFDADVGGYPDNSTADGLKDITGQDPIRTPLTGTDSNAYFRQLIEASVVESEQPFFAKTTYIKTKPDNISNNATTALEAGEVGFGYIMKDATTAVPASSSRPVCVAPLKQGSSAGDMEADPYDGKAIVLFSDTSVRQLNIRKTDSKAVLSGGNHILQGGKDDSVWGTDITPVLKAPLSK